MSEDLYAIMEDGKVFEKVPFNVAVINKDYEIVYVNENYKSVFGDRKGDKCYEAYKNRDDICPHCRVRDVFETGQTRYSNETGVDIDGKHYYYTVHFAPLKDKSGEVKYVLEMSTNDVEAARYQKEHNILFEKSPSYILVIDRDYQVIRANKKLRETFGEAQGKKCYEVFKKKKNHCNLCPAALTFEDGLDHVSTQAGLSVTGEEAQYVVQTIPLEHDEKGVSLVVEISTDITEVVELQDTVSKEREFFLKLIRNSAEGIIALNENDKMQVFNPAAKRILNWHSRKKPNKKRLKAMLPEEFFDCSKANVEPMETCVTTADDFSKPVAFSAVCLEKGKNYYGKACFIRDLSKIRRLEKESFESDKSEAVYKSLEGLAEALKEKAKEIKKEVSSARKGVERNDKAGANNNFDIIDYRTEEIERLVNDYIQSSPNRPPNQKIIDPNDLAEDVFNSMKNKAKKKNLRLKKDFDSNANPAAVEPNILKTALKAIFNYAIGTSSTRKNDGDVTIKTKDSGDDLIFQIKSYGKAFSEEEKSKLFSESFFSSEDDDIFSAFARAKMIILRHGGKLQVESTKENERIFRATLSRKRLDMLLDEMKQKKT